MKFLRSFCTLLLCFLAITAMNAQDPYEEDWLKMYQMEVDGELYKLKAYADSLRPIMFQNEHYYSFLRASIHSWKPVKRNVANAESVIMRELDSIYELLPPAPAAIVQVFKANSLEQIYGNIRRKIPEVSKKDSINDYNFTKWTATDYAVAIETAWKLALKDEDILYNTPASEAGQLIDKKIDDRGLRPTLFDIVAAEAMDYQRNYYYYNKVDRPDDLFIFDDIPPFLSTEDFLAFDIKTQDTLVSSYPLFKLLQRVERLHLENNNQRALEFAYLKRLEYETDERYVPGVEYFKALQTLIATTTDAEVKPLAMFELAEQHIILENSDYPDISGIDVSTIQALALCEEIVESYPESFAVIDAKRLILSIKEIKVNLTSRRVVESNKAFRVLLEYKNTEELELVIFKDRLNPKADSYGVANSTFINYIKELESGK